MFNIENKALRPSVNEFENAVSDLHAEIASISEELKEIFLETEKTNGHYSKWSSREIVSAAGEMALVVSGWEWDAARRLPEDLKIITGRFVLDELSK